MLNTLNKKMSLFLMIVSIVYLIASFRLPAYTYVPVDADVVPISLGFILLTLSIALFFSKEEGTGQQKAIPKKEVMVILAVLGFVLLYIFLLEILGFIVATALFIFFCSWFLGYKKFITNVIVALAIPLFIYLLFSNFLKITLPEGMLPF
ncbi:tripartite tricarboxylate transporter TctB family protein [Pseudalkalibacillus decolorationis]|uniref:tripartite tricarboxylate transporter TctB family protein n=1 Tax=Pseudalkalibacillus decolorationis TaxID=163879 RepID=UPI00214765F7|nr:tripartite tricarboxylate transporter TctB family protein [Pseudalkalibacillus decolorationis]